MRAGLALKLPRLSVSHAALLFCPCCTLRPSTGPALALAIGRCRPAALELKQREPQLDRYMRYQLLRASGGWPPCFFACPRFILIHAGCGVETRTHDEHATALISTDPPTR